MKTLTKEIVAIVDVDRDTGARSTVRGIILETFPHAGWIRRRPIYAQAGKDFLSDISSKGKGCKIFIREELLRENPCFKIVRGKRGSRLTTWIVGGKVDGPYWYATIDRQEDEQKQPVEVPVFCFA